ncbi:MAG: DUF4159 domain-containing protein [Oligoflexales bacterium]
MIQTFFNFEFSAPGTLGFLLALLACFLWWLIRIRQQRMEFPILRILKPRPSYKPKLSLFKPPLIPFLSFIIIAASIITFLLKPKIISIEPIDATGSKIHLFIDMSPSVSEKISLEEYIQEISRIWLQLIQTKHISLSTSHSNKIWNAADQQSLERKLYSLNFHRAGANLGSIISKQWKKIHGVDRFIVISDKDAHSWKNFNWSYLQKDTDLWFHPINRPYSEKINLYFTRAKHLSPPASPVMDWDISIARTGTSEEASGVLEVSLSDQILASIPWAMNSEQKELTLRVSWPSASTPNFEGNPPPLVWKIKPNESDSMLIDNEFRTSLKGMEQSIILVAESGGEQSLESPTHALQASLKILGIIPERFEWIASNKQEAESYPLWILFIGENEDISPYCPKSLMNHRLEPKVSSKSIGTWLIPYISNKKSFQNICWCYHKLQVAPYSGSPMPTFCKEVYDRKSLAVVLKSIGAKQLGGQVGSEFSALAWIGSDEKSHLSTLAFTIPIRPSRTFGITHSQLPIIVKGLLAQSGFFADGSEHLREVWPRINDNTKNRVWLDSTSEQSEVLKFKLSNIPAGESLSKEIGNKYLPPHWENSRELSKSIPNQKKIQENPLPWIFSLLGLIIFASIAELAWHILKRRSLSTSSLILISALLLQEQSTHAQINLAIIASDNSRGVSGLELEVSSRTSLKISKDLVQFSSFDEKLLEEPWLWAGSINSVKNLSGNLDEKIGQWVRRGGILIIQNSSTTEELEKLTEKGFGYQKIPALWRPIPPDHELMRSFYLLDALPTCNGNLWHGFMFDNRLAILAIPYKFLPSLLDSRSKTKCSEPPTRERNLRIFINTLMVALTTDYKKDQIHMREILKRLQ